MTQGVALELQHLCGYPPLERHLSMPKPQCYVLICSRIRQIPIPDAAVILH